jgi:hypothetical protein
MRTKTSGHGRSNPQGLMYSREVMMHVVQREHSDMVVQLFAKGVRQASEASHIHPHVEILTLDVGSRNKLVVRVADDIHALCAKTLRGAVAFLSFSGIAEHLNQLRIVYSFAKRVRNGSQIHLMAVRCQLDSIRQSACYILKEVRRIPRVPRTYRPANHQLRIGVDRRVRPNISLISPILEMLRLYVLRLGTHERPNLIDLDALSGNLANDGVMELITSRADLDKRSQHSTFGRASHTRRGSNGAAFYQRGNYRRLLCDAKNVSHKPIVRQRFRISNSKVTEGTFLLFVFNFSPACFSGLSSAPSALFVAHGFQPALATNPPALSPHVAHDLLNDGKFDSSLNRLNGLDSYVAGVLDIIKFSNSAFPLWHTLQACHETGKTSRYANFK